MCSMPAFEHPDRPKRIAPVPHPRAVFLYPISDEVTVEPIADTTVGPQNVSIKPSAEFSTNPLADGRGESVFREPKDLSRQPRPGELFQQMLCAKAGRLRLRRDSKSQFDDLSVEQRTTDFQAVQHTHPIDFDEHVVGQVDLEIGVLCALNRASGRAP